MLELHHWEPTLDSGEPLIALAEKGLAFQSRYVDLLQLRQHEPQFLRLNPDGQVPVLVHDGRVITEAGLILEYLEDAFPARPLRPRTPVEQYRARVWIKHAEERVAPYVALLGWHTITRPGLAAGLIERARRTTQALPAERRRAWAMALDGAPTHEQLALARESLLATAGLLEQALGQSPWLAGEEYSIADIALVLITRALQCVAPDIVSTERTPRTLAWLSRIEERPAVSGTLALAHTPAPARAFAPGPEPPRWG